MLAKWRKYFFYIIILFMGIFGYFYSEFSSAYGALVKIKNAEHAAADYLPKFYPGNNWIRCTHLICHGLEGEPVAYMFIFTKNPFIQKPEDLEMCLHEPRIKRRELKEKIRQMEESKDISKEDKKKNLLFLQRELQRIRKTLYQWENCVTVITDSRDTEPLAIRCYPGLPAVFVEKQDLQDELEGSYPDKNFKLGRILYFDPFDIRYEVVLGGKNADISAEVTESGENPVSDNAYTFSLNDRSLKSIQKENKKHVKQCAGKQAEMVRMSKEGQKGVKGKILSAFWYPRDVPSGAVVSMYAEVECFPIGALFSFRIYEDNPLFDDEVFTTEGYVSAAEGKYYAKAAWKAEWRNSKLKGDPKFYFTVSKDFICRSSGKNREQELKVRKNMQPTAEKGEFEFSPDLGEATHKDTPLDNRIAIVLIHGNGSDKRQACLNYWYWWCQKFNEPAYREKYKVYRYVYDSSEYIEDNSEKLAQFISDYDEFENQHILVIAHSMGGLVARYALNICDALRNMTKKLITLGTSHFGTPGADPTWVYTSMDNTCGDSLKPFLIVMERFAFQGTKGDFDLAWHKPDEIPLAAFDTIEMFTALSLYDDDLLLNSLENPFTGCNILASELYDEKIIAFGGYFSDRIIAGLGMAKTTPYEIKDEIYGDHTKLFLVQPLMFNMQKRDGSLIGENDGLVPLESSLPENAHHGMEKINISDASTLNEKVDHAAFLDVPLIIDYIMSRISLIH